MKEPKTHRGLAPGAMIGSYRLEEPCGEGGFAVVYRATHEKLQRPAAIKVLHAQLLSRDDLVTRFTREAQTITRIHHPNIVDLYDFGSLGDGRPYFVMEWLEGAPLSTAIRARKHFALADAICIGKEVAAGLGAIHEAGVVHRDVKSNNVMLLSGPGLRIKLLDFGIAKLLEEDHGLSLPGMLLGTPETMSPEQIRGEEVSPASDVYSLGILLFELVTGRLPFTAPEKRELHAMQMHAPRPHASDWAPGVQDLDPIIERCMAIEPSERFQSMAEVIEALDQVPVAPIATAAVLPVGTVLDESYRITGIIGRGGMGTVYEAEHTRLPQRLAIKVISGVVDGEALARFRREAEIASGLGHAHIIRVFDFNTLPDGTPYMVMEYLEGEDLSTVLERGPLAIDRALAIARQAGSALAAAHAGGIVHRDFKPSNIFLSMREVGGEVVEHVTVLDFGVSKIQDSHTVSTDTQALVGTPQYMAPEQAMGENDRLDARSDEFALACVIYEMITGKPAFAGGRLAEIVYRVCHAEPTPLDILVPAMERDAVAAIRRGMSKSPADRFTDVPAFIASLTGRPLEALPRSRKPRTTGARSEPSQLAATKREGSGSNAPAPAAQALPPPSTAATAVDAAPAAPVTDAALAPTKMADARSITDRDSIPTAPQMPAAKAPPGVVFSDPEPAVAAAPARSSRVGRWLIGGGFALVVATFVGALVLGAKHPRFADRPPTDAPTPRTPPPAWSPGVENGKEAMPPVGKATGTDTPTSVVQKELKEGEDGDRAPLAGEPKVPARKDETEADTRAPSQPRTEPISPAARADLEAASSKLDEGDFSAAQRLARRSFQSQETSRGFAIMVKAYCGEGNLGAARDYLGRVSNKRERRSAVRFCSRHGIELGD